jgi:Tfp pilus assembly PilM family ATPase/Tfp pilus assembly protein PilN
MGVKNIPQYIGRISRRVLRSKPIVIVEIGNDWLKILECPVSSDRTYGAKARFMKLSQIKESVSDAISKIFRDLKLNKNTVLACIPRHLVTVRILELPSTDPKEISDMIELQIGKQTPYAKEEIVFSHRIIDAEREGYTKVMLVIAMRSLIKERLVALEKVGIDVHRACLSSEGVYDWFSGVELPRLQNDSGTVIIVDIDSNYSDFIAVYKGRFSFTKNILIGANNLIDERERYQEKFIDELRRSIDLYYEEAKGLKAAKLFLLGASKNIPDLANVLSAHLDIPCQILDTAKFIRIEEDYKFISTTPLVGLAMKYNALQFDLMPNEMRIKKRVEEKKKYLTMAGILFIAIFTMLTFLLFIHICNKNTYKAQLEDKLAKIKDGAQGIDRMRRLITLGQERLDANGDCLTMLSGLYEVMPKEIYLTSVDIERKKQLSIKGRAPVMSDVFKFVGVLESSRYFKNVKNTYATTKKEDNYEYTDFEIICISEE